VKNYILLSSIALVSFLAGAGSMYTYGVLQPVPPAAPIARDVPVVTATPDGSVTAEGLLVKDQPDLKPGVWFVAFEDGGNSYAVELSFDEQSRCFGKTTSGKCAPDRFIADRQVAITGAVNGETLLVRELRFPVPLTE
jgi:hypothetical protein